MGHIEIIEKALMTEKECADYLRLAPVTLRLWRYRRTSGPPFTKVGRKVLYRREDVDSWLKDNVRQVK